VYAYLGGHAAVDPGNGTYHDVNGDEVEAGHVDVIPGEQDGSDFDRVSADIERPATFRPAPVEGKQRLEVNSPAEDGKTALEVFQDITSPGGIASYWLADGSTFTWVSSDNDDLASLLAAAYSAEVRPFLPQGERDEHAERPVVKALLGTTLATMLLLPFVMLLAALTSAKLRTDAGRDWQSDVMGSAAGVPAKYMALSATAAESAAHTSLAGEITTASGGLIRKAATYAHTTGTSTYTQTATFTANGSDSLPVTVKQCALLTASSSGVLAFEKIISDTLFAVSGDAATVTYTVTP
jgi:hypothetical protein